MSVVKGHSIRASSILAFILQTAIASRLQLVALMNTFIHYNDLVLFAKTGLAYRDESNLYLGAG